MDTSQKKILQLESTIHALNELLTVSESSFLQESKKLEEANELLKKENTYRLFFEASPEAMLTLYDNCFIDCNQSAVKMLAAKNKDEVLNTHPWDLSPEYQPDGRLSSEKAKEMIANAQKQGAYCFEWHHKRMNGEVFPAEVMLTMITVEGKKMFNVSWQDITQKKQDEEELNKYHKHLEELVKSKTEEISVELEKHKRLENDIKQILNSSSDAVRVIDKDYNIVYTSKSFSLLHGQPEDIVGKKCYDMVPEKECFTKNCSLKRILKTGKRFAREKKIKALDGTTKLYNIDIIPYKDSNGNLLGIIKNYRDITEEKQAEERLAAEIREHEKLAEKYRILFETSGDAIAVFDEKGFFDCNQATLDLLGYSSKEKIIGKSPVDITTAKQADGQKTPIAYKEHIKKASKEGTDCFEWICVRKDGTELPTEVMLSRMEYQGKEVMLSVVRDISERKKAEERLAEEVRKREILTEKYRILFETSGDAIMLNDEKGFFDCNQATLDLFGFSKKEFLKLGPVDVTTAKQANGQDSAIAAREHMEKAFREGTDFFEWNGVRKDGSVFPGEVMLSRMEYQNSMVTLAIVRDISERKQAEDRLAGEIREREALVEKYRVLFETSGDAIMMLDKKGFYDCNKATLELFGFSSKKQFFRIHPADISVAKQPDGRDSFTAANEHIERAFREGTDFFEWLHKRSDNTPFPAEVLLSRMEYKGKVVIQATVRDISERKQAEEKIRSISAIQNLILENSTIGICLVRNRVFEWVNPRIGELFLLPTDKIQGASTRVIYPSDESYEELGRTAYPMLVNGGRSDNTIELKRSDGSLFWCRFIGKALDSKNIQGGSIWILEDITEEKEARKIAEENAQQQGRIEMANNVLHDIGNAMTGVSTYVLKPQMEKVWQEIKSLYQLRDLFIDSQESLIKVFGEEKQKALNDFMKALIASFEDRHSKYLKAFEKISVAVGHVCSVLDLQRHYLKENASPLATKINLPAIIGDTLVMLSGSLQKRDISVSLDVKDKNLKISGDQTRLIRVFLNIIKNTCEAFDEKGPAEDERKLEITAALHKNKGIVQIVFTDNGIGFAAGTGEKLFERGVTSKSNGSGIGLHECRSIIESHAGKITMESNGINTGASTIITFPILK